MVARIRREKYRKWWDDRFYGQAERGDLGFLTLQLLSTRQGSMALYWAEFRYRKLARLNRRPAGLNDADWAHRQYAAKQRISRRRKK